MDSSDVIALIKKAHTDHSIEGVTFLGGEPLLQARGLSHVASEVRMQGLSVMVFTGYLLEDLARLSLAGVPSLLAATDLLVDGPFEYHEPESLRNWVGSCNQRFHYLSTRYEPKVETDASFMHGFEMRIGADSLIRLNGWPVDFHRRSGNVISP
jgi:anaerobic ribonucleoside-triphosphate reductase activating protein